MFVEQKRHVGICCTHVGLIFRPITLQGLKSSLCIVDKAASALFNRSGTALDRTRPLWVPLWVVLFMPKHLCRAIDVPLGANEMPQECGTWESMWVSQLVSESVDPLAFLFSC